jgi:hypothetical protein
MMNMKVWMNGIWEIAKDALCQKILASHLPADPTLPDLTGFSCIVTGPTSGIGLHTARWGINFIRAIVFSKSCGLILMQV